MELIKPLFVDAFSCECNTPWWFYIQIYVDQLHPQIHMINNIVLSSFIWSFLCRLHGDRSSTDGVQILYDKHVKMRNFYDIKSIWVLVTKDLLPYIPQFMSK